MCERAMQILEVFADEKSIIMQNSRMSINPTVLKEARSECIF